MRTIRGNTARRWALAFAVAVSVLGGNASAILLDRGPDMVYDTVLDITWTRNANLPGSAGLDWSTAKTWAADLVFAGFDDWRLPYASVIAGAGPLPGGANVPCTGAGGADEVACRDNEMAYMFYYNLGGTFPQNKTGNQTAMGDEMLADIQPIYWTGTEGVHVPPPVAWFFLFNSSILGGQGGEEGISFTFFGLSAWAVRDGDVAGASAPGSLALLGLGALALGLFRRRVCGSRCSS